jgi:hypothetical protein
MDGPAFKALNIRSLTPSEAESASKRGAAFAALFIAQHTVSRLTSRHTLRDLRVIAHFRWHPALSSRNGHFRTSKAPPMPGWKRHSVRFKFHQCLLVLTVLLATSFGVHASLKLLRKICERPLQAALIPSSSMPHLKNTGGRWRGI